MKEKLKYDFLNTIPLHYTEFYKSVSYSLSLKIVTVFVIASVQYLYRTKILTVRFFLQLMLVFKLLLHRSQKANS